MKKIFLLLIFLLSAFNCLFADNTYNLQPTNGPYGGFCWSFCYDTVKKNIFVTNEKIYKLNTTTSKWERQFAALDSFRYRYFSMVYADSVYLLSYSEGDNDDRWGSGLMRSTDKGNSWKDVSNFYSNLRGVVSVNNYLFGAGDDSVYKSSDQGLKWSSCKTGIDSLDLLERSYSQIEKIHSNGTDYLFLRDFHNGIYRSSNYGESWEKISGSLPISQNSSYTDYTAMTTTIDNKLIVSSSAGIFFSMDFGNSWSEIIGGIRNFKGFGMNFLKSDPQGNVYTGAYGIGLLRLKQNDTTWNFMNEGLIPVSTYDLFFGDSSGNVLAATDCGVYKSTNNGDSWFFFNDGIATPIPIECIISVKNVGIFAGSERNGIYFSSDKGNSWTTVNNGITDESILKLIVDSKGIIYAASDENNLFKSSNNGRNWEKLYTGNMMLYTGLRNIAINSKDEIIIPNTYDSLILSKDGGKSWINIGFKHSYVSAVTYDRNDNLIIAADSSIYRTTDYGITWETVLQSDHHIDFHCFYVSQNNIIYAGTHKDKIFKSSDGGTTWTKLEQGFTTETNISCIGSPDMGNRIICGSYNEGYFISNDEGLSWTSYTENLPPYTGMIVQELFREFAYDGQGTLFAATFTGVYKWDNILTVQQNNNEPSELEIFPNPASEFIEISVGSRHALPNADIRILNVFGEIVSTSVCSADTSASGGQRIDVSGLPSGVYFVRVGGRVMKFIKI